MTEERNPSPWERGQLRREATEWFVLMRSPDAERHRPEFTAWLNRGGLHRAAYNRVANLFGSGKGVDWEALPPARPVRGTIRRSAFFTAGSLMVLAFVLSRFFSSPLSSFAPHLGRPPVYESAEKSGIQIATRMGEIRRQRLADGSWVTLDTDTLVSVDYDRAEREIRLEHGRARFEVSHERRPFVVDAAFGRVIAHGTIFDVSVGDDQRVHVALIRGAVDVKTRERHGPARFAVTRLQPGQGVAYAIDGSDAVPPAPAAGEPDAAWPTGNIDLPNGTLADVIATANRYSSTKIRLSDGRLGQVRVSGSFRVNDPRRLAAALGGLLHLQVREDRNEVILASDSQNKYPG